MEKPKTQNRESPLEIKLFDNESKLIFTTPMSIGLSATTFYGDKGSSTLSVPGTLMKRLVAMFDGHKTLKQIKDNLVQEWNENSIDFLVTELLKRQLLIEAHRKVTTVFDLVKNPQMYPSAITKDQLVALEESAVLPGEDDVKQEKVKRTDLMKIMSARESWRDFSKETITEENLQRLLWCAFGKISDDNNKRTFPSAGGLYPTKLSLVLFRSVGKYASGIYEVVSEEKNSVGLKKISDNQDDTYRTYLDPMNISSANGVLVINGSIDQNSKKYGNRSMLYTVLEAGHIAQNFLLSATEQELAAVELGGYYDDQLADTIGLTNGYKPLASIAFGVKDENPPVKDEKDPEVFWSMTEADGYHAPFTMAMCRISKDLIEDWSYGRDVNPEIAKAKAVSEAKEWAACGCIPEDLVQGKFTELDNAIDPESILRYADEQINAKDFTFRPFDKNEPRSWVKATKVSDGSEYLLLSDLAYFPYYPDYEIYGYANSSGVAAHPDKQKSIENGALELIERDSFMNAYLSKITFPTIDNNSLTRFKMQERIKALEEKGFEVYFKDYTIDLAPVVFVYVRNKELGYSNCACCCKFDIEQAASHALMEVEASVLARLQNGPHKPITVDDVIMPADHGGIYENTEHYNKAHFLVEGGEKVSIKEAGKNGAKDWVGFMDRLKSNGFDLYTMPLELSEKYGGNGNLSITRSVIPGLAPLTFGYKLEAGGLSRIYEIAERYGKGKTSFDDLTKFPHPFS